METFIRQNNIVRKDGVETLRSLVCPVLILAGENDKLTPVEDHRELMSLVPHANW